MITAKDYREMEVLVNGEWIKANVLKILDDGTCLYLMGEARDGVYISGACVPAREFRELEVKPTTKTVVKSAVAIMQILQDEDYSIDSVGDWVHPDRELEFTINKWESCGSEPDLIFSYEDNWLEEVEV